jgi:GPH family glycoside/pentoside/hexuronide:cation symporter
VQLTLGLIPAILPFYAKYVLHIPNSILSLLLGSIFITALLLVVPWTHLIRRLGSHKALNWTIVCLAVGVIPFSLSTRLAVILPSAVILGAGLAGFLTLADVLMAEVIDHDAGAARPRREGIFYGINGFILRLGVSVQALLLYVVLHFTGYYANSAGRASITVQDGFRSLMSLFPLIFLIVAFLVIQRFTVPESAQQTSALQDL